MNLKSCIKCGSMLPISASSNVTCPNCNTENTIHNKIELKAKNKSGEKISPQEYTSLHEQQVYSKGKINEESSNSKYTLTILIAVGIFVFYYLIINFEKNKNNQSIIISNDNSSQPVTKIDKYCHNYLFKNSPRKINPDGSSSIDYNQILYTSDTALKLISGGTECKNAVVERNKKNSETVQVAVDYMNIVKNKTLEENLEFNKTYNNLQITDFFPTTNNYSSNITIIINKIIASKMKIEADANVSVLDNNIIIERNKTIVHNNLSSNLDYIYKEILDTTIKSISEGLNSKDKLVFRKNGLYYVDTNKIDTYFGGIDNTVLKIDETEYKASLVSVNGCTCFKHTETSTERDFVNELTYYSCDNANKQCVDLAFYNSTKFESELHIELISKYVKD